MYDLLIAPFADFGFMQRARPARCLPRHQRRRRDDRHQGDAGPVHLRHRNRVVERELGLGGTVEGDKDVAVARHGCILAPASLAVPWTM